MQSSPLFGHDTERWGEPAVSCLPLPQLAILGIEVLVTQKQGLDPKSTKKGFGDKDRPYKLVYKKNQHALAISTLHILCEIPLDFPEDFVMSHGIISHISYDKTMVWVH